ncbi:hypothetical protein KP509_33G044300 [Ceratopteris richardii]|nr:hypothetical protein KP509_33G044300 [Ceratopteris richardii]
MPGIGAHLVHANESDLLWSTNTTGKGVTAMQLLDTGNLVLLDAANMTVWQSFDYPTDTLLSGQILRPQLGMELISRVSEKNYSLGSYILALAEGDLQLFFSAYESSPLPYWSMSEDQHTVSYLYGVPNYVELNSTGLSLVRNDSVVLSLIPLMSDATLCRATLEADGNFNIYVFSSNVWTLLFSALPNSCDLPLYCGPRGLCSVNQCSCPGSLVLVDKGNVAQGCQGFVTSSCTENSSSQIPSDFERVGENIDYFANSFLPPTKTSGLEECQELCAQNCSCNAFFFYNESNLCFMYTELGTVYSTSANHFLYIRTLNLGEAPDRQPQSTSTNEKENVPPFALPLIIVGTVIIILVLIGSSLCYYYKSRKCSSLINRDDSDDFPESILGLPTRYTFKELQLATNNFSKKLGQGGFGSVYEGVLSDSTKVAVKQLESVQQGKREFRAEIAIIGSIHHVHLVQLRGFCAEGVHRLLVYEYMSNGSLDTCLFPSEGSTKLLDWNTRYKVALGTAKGLAYLHTDCRGKIIHCDIKPQNILLDEDFTAKVSDFGLAKLLTKQESQVFTKMRGTRGYLAPEWITNSAISEKTDVYSFGMVLLEIISGRKNYESSENSEKCYFPAYAFAQAGHGCHEQLIDQRLTGGVDIQQAIEAIKVSLWCIQEEIPLRPSMTKVIQMLEGTLKVPDPPLFSRFAIRLHDRMVEASACHQTSSNLAAVQLSAAR